MEFKGTKGQWVRYTATSPSIELPTKHSVYVGTQRISLCYNLFESDKTLNVNEKEAEYNAQLIAHAPEMLDMLKMLYNFGELNEYARTRVKQMIQKATEI